MKQYQVVAEYSITRTIGYYNAESEEEAIKNARSNIYEMAEELGVSGPDNTWAEEQGE
jgi:hypothetical protein